MNPDQARCGACGAALAPADALCPGCGAEVAVAQRAALLGERAEAYARQDRPAEAARAAEAVLALPLSDREAHDWWRKRAAWLARTGVDADLDESERSLRRALELDDGDDLGHQLWIDVLRRLGRLDEATALYQARLTRDPSDAAAARHLAALKLMRQMQDLPLPKLDLPPPKPGLFERALRPTTGKMVAAAVGVVSCGAMLFSAGGPAPKMPPGAESVQAIAQWVEDPWLNALQVALYGAYLVWGWRSRRGR